MHNLCFSSKEEESAAGKRLKLLAKVGSSCCRLCYSWFFWQDIIHRPDQKVDRCEELCMKKLLGLTPLCLSLPRCFDRNVCAACITIALTAGRCWGFFLNVVSTTMCWISTLGINSKILFFLYLCVFFFGFSPYLTEARIWKFIFTCPSCCEQGSQVIRIFEVFQ